MKWTRAGAASARRRPRRGGRARPDPEEARDPAQLPGGRAPALPARAVRPRAAPVHRHLQRRGAARSAATSGAGSTPRRSCENNYFGFGTDNDMENTDGLPDHQAPHLRRPGRTDRPRTPTRRCRCRRPRCSGGRAAGATRSGPASVVNVSGMSFGALSGERDRGAQPGRPTGRLPAEHRRGRRSRRTTATAATWSSRSVRRTSAAATRPGASTWPGSRTWSRRRRSAPSRSSCRRAPSPASAGCCPARRSARRSPRSAASSPGVDCASPSRHRVFHDVDSMLDFVETGRRPRPGCRSASSPRSATWSSGTTWSQLMAGRTAAASTSSTSTAARAAPARRR